MFHKHCSWLHDIIRGFVNSVHGSVNNVPGSTTKSINFHKLHMVLDINNDYDPMTLFMVPPLNVEGSINHAHGSTNIVLDSLTIHGSINIFHSYVKSDRVFINIIHSYIKGAYDSTTKCSRCHKICLRFIYYVINIAYGCTSTLFMVPPTLSIVP